MLTCYILKLDSIQELIHGLDSHSNWFTLKEFLKIDFPKQCDFFQIHSRLFNKRDESIQEEVWGYWTLIQSRNWFMTCYILKFKTCYILKLDSIQELIHGLDSHLNLFTFKEFLKIDFLKQCVFFQIDSRLFHKRDESIQEKVWGYWTNSLIDSFIIVFLNVLTWINELIQAC